VRGGYQRVCTNHHHLRRSGRRHGLHPANCWRDYQHGGGYHRMAPRLRQRASRLCADAV